MALIERPYRYSFTANEIRYIFQLADPDRAGLFLQVRIMVCAIGGTTFSELIAFNLKPTEFEGKVFFYLNDYLDSMVNFVLPDMGAVLTDANEQAIQFYIEYREIEDAVPEPDYDDSESDHIRIAIKGGIEQHKHRRNNFFINYLHTERPFLTWQPQGKFMYIGEPLVLSFINKIDDVEFSDSKVVVTTVLADGTSSDLQLAVTCDKFIMHLLPFNEIAQPDPEAANKVHYYEFKITNGSPIADNVTNAYRVYVHYRPAYQYYDLIYINSIGGASNVRLITDTLVSYDRTVTDGQRGIDLNAWQNKKSKQQSFQPSRLLNKKYNGNIGVGLMNEQLQREAMVELFAAEEIYQAAGEYLIPVLAIAENVAIGNKKTLAEGLPLQWALSESNSVYTPSGKYFGEGTDTEIY